MSMTRLPLAMLSLALALLAPVSARADGPPHKADSAPVTAPGPGEANALLVAGNGRFVNGTTTHPHQSLKRLGETAGGQHPFVTVLSCSDSRVPPELIFDEGVGDVFSVRVAGNVVDTDEMGSVEYGIDHLGTPLLVVMGHTKCGAVTAVATNAPVHGHIPALVSKIGPAVAAAHAKSPNLSDAEIVPEAIRANVLEAMATLIRESDAVRERVDTGKTQMVGAIYDISSGKVEWLGRHPDEANLVIAARKAPAEHAPKHGAEHGTEHGATDAGAHGAKHGKTSGNADAGAAGHGEPGKAEAKDGPDAHGPAEPPPAPFFPPYSFALVALLCTLGGVISGRAFSRS